MSVKYALTKKTIVALMELEMMVASNPGTAKKKDKNDENFYFQNIKCKKIAVHTLHKY